MRAKNSSSRINPPTSTSPSILPPHFHHPRGSAPIRSLCQTHLSSIPSPSTTTRPRTTFQRPSRTLRLFHHRVTLTVLAEPGLIAVRHQQAIQPANLVTMTEEAHKAFQYLKENVPKWLESLELVRARLAEKHHEVLRAPVAPKRRKERSGSMESIRPDDNDTASSFPTRITPTPQAVPTRPLPPLANVLAKRKRDTASMTTGRVSGPPKYRMRQQMVVVYYDSEVQKSFDTLVRSIGTGRNLLRKGKMAAKMEALSASMFGEDDSSSGDNDDEPSAKIDIRSKLSGFRMTRSPRGGRNFLGKAESAGDNFDSADKDLEKAQSLCERGAHQFLRDGDCAPELDGCRSSFNKVLKLSETLAARQRAREEETQSSEATPKIHEPASIPIPKQMQPVPRTPEPIEEKRISFHRPDPIDLEVDGDEEDFDESTFAAIRPPVRLTRMQVKLMSRTPEPTEEKRISFHRPDPIGLEVDDDEENFDESTFAATRPPIRLTRRV